MINIIFLGFMIATNPICKLCRFLTLYPNNIIINGSRRRNNMVGDAHLRHAFPITNT